MKAKKNQDRTHGTRQQWGRFVAFAILGISIVEHSELSRSSLFFPFRLYMELIKVIFRTVGTKADRLKTQIRGTVTNDTSLREFFKIILGDKNIKEELKSLA